MTTTTTTSRGSANQLTAIAGEHFVAGELRKRGWIATLTAKNTPSIDILATRPADEDPAGKILVRIDVKTSRTAAPSNWLIGGVHLSGRRDFIVLVGLGDKDAAPRYWIVPARDAADCVIVYDTRTVLPLRDVEEYEGCWDLLDQ